MIKIVQREKDDKEDRPARPAQTHSPKVPRKLEINKVEQLIQKNVEKVPAQPTASLPPTSTLNKMEASIQLIDDDLELMDFKDLISEANKSFTVIGAVGSQGTGKSTLLSMLAGNSPLDMYRQYIFRPASREAVESCRYQTTKIFVYISPKTRMIFLDCQPLNCAPLLEDSSHSYRSKAGPLESLELETLQFLLLLANVCHTIILCIDWFIDMSVLRRLMRIELFPNYLRPEGEKVNLVVLHQRAKPIDFQPILVQERMQQLEQIFANSTFKIDSGLTMSRLGFSTYSNIKSNVNYIVLSELKPRTRTDFHSHEHQKTQGIEYDAVVSSLRTKIVSLPRNYHFESEGKWYSYLIDNWNKLKGLSSMTEDGCTIKKNTFVNSTSHANATHETHFDASNNRENRRVRAEMIGPPLMGKRSNYGSRNRRHTRGDSKEWRNKKNVPRKNTNE